MPKKNDNIVGRSEGPIVGGGHQTADQARIVGQGGHGKTDSERRRMERGEPAGAAPVIGGSSGGHSDQIAGAGPDENRKVADGLYQAERTKRDPESGKGGH